MKQNIDPQKSNYENRNYTIKFSLMFGLCAGIGWILGGQSDKSYAQLALNFSAAWAICSLVLLTTGLLCSRILEDKIRQAESFFNVSQIKKPFGTKERKIQFSYELTDYIAANRFHHYRQFRFWYGIILMGILDIGLGIMVYRDPADMVLWVVFVTFVTLPIYSHFTLPRRAQKLFLRQKQLNGLQEFVLKPGVMATKNPVTTQEHRWFYKVEIGRDFLLAFNTPATFIILPRRAFRNDDQYMNWILEIKKLSTKP